MTKFEHIVAIARETIAAKGYAEIARSTLDAGWLSAGMAPAVARELGVNWSRNDKAGTFVFGAGAAQGDQQ